MSNYPLKIIVPPVLMCFLMLAGGCNQQLAKQEKVANPKAPFLLSALASPVPNAASDQKPVSRPNGEVVLSWWQKLPDDKRTLLVSALQNRQ